MTSTASPRAFATTRWAVISAASNPDHPGHEEALGELCRLYWYPIYAFIRRKGFVPPDAEDLTQEFFSRLLAKKWLANVEENGSRFRAFLLTAVSRFLLNEYDRSTAAKRGSGLALLNLEDAETRFLSTGTTPESSEKSYDREWAIAVMDGAFKRLQTESQTGGKGEMFEKLSAFLSREPGTGEYDGLAKALNLKGNALNVAVYRLRKRYREVVRSIVAETVSDPAELDAELKHLAAVLRNQL